MLRRYLVRSENGGVSLWIDIQSGDDEFDVLLTKFERLFLQVLGEWMGPKFLHHPMLRKY